MTVLVYCGSLFGHFAGGGGGGGGGGVPSLSFWRNVFEFMHS